MEYSSYCWGCICVFVFTNYYSHSLITLNFFWRGGEGGVSIFLNVNNKGEAPEMAQIVLTLLMDSPLLGITVLCQHTQKSKVSNQCHVDVDTISANYKTF